LPELNTRSPRGNGTRLDDLGSDGWELVAVAYERAYFKRELQVKRIQ